MRSEIENRITEMLNNYMKFEGINQIELSKRLGWSAQDLNDTLKGRKPIGKNRQVHIAKKLNFSLKSLGGVILNSNDVRFRETQIPYGLNESDLEIAKLCKKLTKKQKELLKLFLKSITEVNK